MYSKILVAVDATDESRQVVAKAAYLKQQTGAAVTLLHVVEPIAYAYGGDIPLDIGDIQKQIEDNARKQLGELDKEFELGADIEVTVGRPEAEIHRMAEEKEAGLIVVGSHGRHGLQLLLGSTANGVLHGAKCDVLAVRVHEAE